MRPTAMMSLASICLVGCKTKVEPFDAEACFSELATALAADDMEGRGIGSAGLEKAAALLEARMRDAGLADAGVGYRQTFDAVTGVALGASNALKDSVGTLGLDEDFTPLGFTSNGTFDADVVFAGYGIVAPDLGYDDYAGLDVKGKAVLIMRYEPGEADENSPFDGKKPSRYSDLRYKAMKARELGAAALIFVAPPREADEPDKLPPLSKHGPTSRAGLPVIQVRREVADRWLAASGSTLLALQARIDGANKPASQALTGIRVTGSTDVIPTEATASNVLGVLPGHGALAGEVVVVGAHYDHLGHGGDGSMRPDSTEIHNGADDNASGTAAMVCALASLAQGDLGAGPRRTILGIAFAAEEIGLGGSAHYVDHPVLPIDKTIAMVNLDMVGRVREGKLQALGSETAPEWADLLKAAGTAADLTVEGSGDGYGPSDQTSFYEKQVPVVHLFSGAHEEYHTPDDDAATLNMAGGGQVTTLVADLASRLAQHPTALTYVKSAAGPRNMGDSRGYGAYLGTIPDFSAMSSDSGGVKLSDVRKEGPADRAGVKGGDILVGLAGAEVQNLHDMTFLLQDNKPGETVEVVVLRDGQRLTLKATLGKRGESSGGGTAPAADNNPAAHPDRFSVGADTPASGEWFPTAGKAVSELLQADEKHLADLRQLTFGGENAEAYWSPDGRKVIFQRTPTPNQTCDQQYVLDLTTGEVTRISSGKGRTTCGYYDFPKGDRFLYATTEGGGEACPPNPDRSKGYVWPLFPTYELVWQVPGQAPTPFLPAPGYDAEATACMKDGRLVFTSTRDGDLDLYLVNSDGTGLERLTSSPGYDGGAFFNPSCTAIVWRASRPEGTALAEYKKLLGEDLVRPSALEVYWMDLASRDVTQLTDNGAANFGPYALPDDSGVVYSSNVGGNPREFDIWFVSRDRARSERITTAPGFDGFPMFSPDGKWFVFASNRATAEGKSDTNLFVARWIE